ncbi:DNA topoisomerase 2-binding protein 1-like [Chironomus tepperi]|uniref:DNA topoisomerase 2-binding protein 1-like n=1 Tax=Chironomus tepperi TaxID=113505 RepID=UPI00391FA836
MMTTINLTTFCSQSSGDIKFIFVKETDENTQNNNMEKVMDEIRELHPESDIIDVLCPDDVFEMEKPASKRYIFVFETFDSPAFDHISKMVGVYILGLKCVMSVIHDNLEIPESIFHINNLCMKDMILCFSSIGDPEKKSRMKRLIGYMGGLYSNSLTEDITHLVTEDIFSKKYLHAGSHNIKIMHTSWIDEIWKLSQDFNFVVTPKVHEKFKLKMFNNLVFSSTGLDKEEKKTVITLIEDNGGEYSHTFRSASVKVLLMKQKDIGCVKYKASTKHSILCIDPSWVIDSAKAKYALNKESYLITKQGKLKSSTPTKNTSALGKFSFDNTVISEICDFTARSIAIDETQKSTRASSNFPQKLESSVRPSTSLRPSKSNTSVKESTFKRPTAPSKKKDSSIQSPPRFDYTEDASDESFIQILIDKTVCVYGYGNDIDSMQVIKECEKLGAKLVDLAYTKTVDYVITSTDIMDLEIPKLKYKNLVSDIWLEESVEIGRCIEPPKFYHRSLFKIPEKHQVLKDEIFVCSNYDSNRQRPFIRFLVKLLGGVCKEALSRAEGPILICPSPEGKKYEGAKNWGLTVIKAEWLVECLIRKIRVDETEYLVGDTKASRRNIKKRESIIPSSQEMSVDSIEDVDMCKSPEKNPSVPASPKTPLPNVDEGRIGNLSWLLEDLATPEREVATRVLLKYEKKNVVSPRSKLLKDLMQTPGTTEKELLDYVPSPCPELPESMLPPDRNYALFPDSSPATQWFYKIRMEALDDRYVPVSQSRRKELKNIPETPPLSHIRYDFFKKRLSDFDSPDPRAKADETDGLFMARITANMSNEASKFLNFEDTEANGTTTNQQQNTDIMKLDELLKQNTSQEEKNLRRSSSAPQAGENDSNVNKNMMDFNPKSPDCLVRWSNTQMPSTAGFHHESQEQEVIQMEDGDDNQIEDIQNYESDEVPINVSEQERPINASDPESPINASVNDENSENKFIFGISSGMNAEDKLTITEKIEHLGGTVTEQEFTHLIMTKLSKSSKFFSALSSGKVILHSDYIDECLEQARFIETDCFEFGNPQFNCAVSNLKDPQLLNGPYRCRMLMKNNPEKFRNGLFTGMNFILIVNSERIAQFAHIIEIGGGTIIDEQPEFKVSVLKRNKIDYCLIENSKSLTKKDAETLRSCGIEIKNIKFIYDYLLSDDC